MALALVFFGCMVVVVVQSEEIKAPVGFAPEENHNILQLQQQQQQQQQQQHHYIRRLSSGKPAIYTFWDEVKVSKSKNVRSYNEKINVALLETWKREWHHAGFEIRILTLKDAKRHPRYEEFLGKLNNIKMIGQGSWEGRYNELCFLRWLAMAAVGGGFMCDYDVLPIKGASSFAELAGNGEFTVYDEVPNRGGVPSLMSGSADEWTRMSFEILNYAFETPPTDEFNGWSDFASLLLLNTARPGTYILTSYVGRVQTLLAHPLGPETCKDADPFVALHFSHADIARSGRHIGERHIIGKELVGFIQKNCASQLSPTPVLTKQKGLQEDAALFREEVAEATAEAAAVVGTSTRPKMHTFFDEIDPDNADMNRDQLRLADAALIEEWKRAWYGAGFEPIILTLKDAERHPMYSDFVVKLEYIKMIGHGSPRERYNQLCFIRWLAMASSDGGGFMSDYDVLPIEDVSLIGPMAASGDFIVFDAVKNWGGIPSLMAGNQDEWLRMALAVLDTAYENTPLEEWGAWSDFLALMELNKSHPGSYRINDVVGEVESLLSNPFHEEDSCKEVKGNVALHFSHAGIHKTGHRIEDRAALAHDAVAFISEHCGKHSSKR